MRAPNEIRFTGPSGKRSGQGMSGNGLQVSQGQSERIDVLVLGVPDVFAILLICNETDWECTAQTGGRIKT